jgi:hypothetical protein
LSALFLIAPAYGGEHGNDEPTIIMKLKSDEVELDEIDISDLEVGDAHTVFTDSGKTVDILRTVGGFEIYVDGEELKIPNEPLDMESLAGNVHYGSDIEIECLSEDGNDCDAHGMIIMPGDEDSEIDLSGKQAHVIKIHKEYIDEEGGDPNGESGHDNTHSEHSGAHKVIMIRKHVTEEDEI